jgi:hypothetical protein
MQPCFCIEQPTRLPLHRRPNWRLTFTLLEAVEGFQRVSEGKPVTRDKAIRQWFPEGLD